VTEPAQVVLVQMGGFYFGGGRLRLRTLLGSCVALTLWHPRLRIGGMCHYMLPSTCGSRPPVRGPAGLYALDALQLFRREIHNAGTQPSDYIAKMFGGGSMFPEYAHDAQCAPPCAEAARQACRDVPCKNIVTGHVLLEREGIALAAEDVGGEGSRVLIFDVWTGDAWVRRSPVVPSEA
jgi:chemotaxis protein CheD